MGWLSSHSCEISSVLPPRIFPESGFRAVGLRLGRVQFDPVSKVFLMVISGKRVPYKCLNGGTSDGECINVVEEGLTLEGEIVRYSSELKSHIG